jgi:hypothetical protein
MLGMELHVLLVIARQVNGVYLKLQLGFLRFGSATSDFVLFITQTCENRRLIKSTI